MSLGIDWDNVKEDAGTDFQPLPAGKYLAEVRSILKTATKNNDGEYLNTCFSILEKEYAGRKVWHMFHFKNKNPKAVEIALSQLKSLCRVCGVDPRSFDQNQEVLNRKEVVLKLKVEHDSTYGDKNRVVDFLPAKGQKVYHEAPQVNNARDINVPSGDVPF